MAYRLVVSERAQGQLAKLDRQVARRLMGKLMRLALQAETAQHKALSGSMAGQYSYRVGDYRAVYGLDHDRATLVVYRVGHRRDIYRS